MNRRWLITPPSSVDGEQGERRGVRDRIRQQAEYPVRANVESLRGSMLQDLDAPFRAFAAELDEGMADAIRATHGAIAAAVEARRRHEEESLEMAACREQGVAMFDKAIARLKERDIRGSTPVP